jgi:hypothetical protein
VVRELRIRALEPGDLDQIFPRGGRPHGERWLERQSQAEIYVAVAELAGVPAGRVGLDFVRLASDGAAHLWSAHVEPGYQSQGIGTAPMLHLQGSRAITGSRRSGSRSRRRTTEHAGCTSGSGTTSAAKKSSGGAI